MYESNLNIKHSNRSHLYWGIDKATEEIVGIDEIQARGLNCNCKCAACGGDFIAKKERKTNIILHTSPIMNVFTPMR